MKQQNFSTYLQNIIPGIDMIAMIYKRYLKKYLVTLVISILLMLIVATLTAVTISLIKPIINRAFIERDIHYLYKLSAIIFIIALAKAIFSFMQLTLISIIYERIIMDLRGDVFNKMIRLPMSYIDRLKRGQFVSYFMNDIQVICEALSTIFIVSFREFFTIIGLVILVFLNNFTLACIAFVFFPAMFVPLTKITKSLRKKYVIVQEKYDIISAKFTDILCSIKYIKVFNTENKENRRFYNLLLSNLRETIKFRKKSSIGSPMMEFFSTLSVVMVILYGGHSVIYHKSNPGAFFSFIAALLMAYKPTKAMSNINNKIQTASIAAKRIFDFLDLPEENIKNGTSVNFANNYDISFQDVCFDYKISMDENITLSNITFNIKTNEKVAFVGSSGSGKSTITSLLLGLYKIDSGNIEIAGSNVDNLSLSTIRKNIGYVGQENLLLGETIREDLLYGLDSASISNVEELNNKISDALNISKVDFLNDQLSLDQKINHSRFSSGQRQRICIARAVMMNAPILILDEATAALDNITEKNIRNNIFNQISDKTVIMIAHRLQNVIECDRIYVMDAGRIVESGKHQELLEKKGLYHTLWQACIE